MTVKIVTNTLSDIPAELAKELGITVVPLYVRFGEKSTVMALIWVLMSSTTG